MVGRAWTWAGPAIDIFFFFGRGMLKSYQLQNGGLKGTEVLEGAPIAAESLWIDLYNPSIGERRAVDALLGMELPTRAAFHGRAP